MASKRGESLQPWLKLGIFKSGSCAGTIECINVGFGEVLDLREVYKGEEVTVGIAIIAPAIVSPFQGLGNL